MDRHGEALNVESERRFLVRDHSVMHGQNGVEIEQGYLFGAQAWEIRVRCTYQRVARESFLGSPDTPPSELPVEELASTLTLKGPRSGVSRPEYEMLIGGDHARTLLRLTDRRVLKTRYSILDGEDGWEIDQFWEGNEGLVLAECESDVESLRQLKIPDWVGLEVTHDERYGNESLARNPWQNWREEPSPTTHPTRPI